jgi:hypothetical protein
VAAQAAARCPAARRSTRRSRPRNREIADWHPDTEQKKGRR